MRFAGTLARSSVALVATVSVTACIGGGATPPPSGSPLPSIADCIVKSATKGQMDETALGLAGGAPLITVGTFNGYGAPAWNTPDGSRPTQAQVLSGAPIAIWRPIRTTTDVSIKGDAKRVTSAVAAGGSIGCDKVDYGDPGLTEGARYVLFFTDVSDSLGKLQGDLVLVTAWSVGADGTVTRPVEAPLSVEALEAEINGPVPAVTPYPTATPEDPGPG
jgi:hypothetical protein